jgi:D-serine deaminase-like pyridoxal phosphate-dependent protein
MRIDDLDTPAFVVDLDVMEANLQAAQRYLDQHGLVARPHVKTHKIPAIAQMQIAAGAAGLTCQKIGEAEVMAAAGLRDLFLPYNIVGAAKLERLVALARAVTLSVTVDSETVARGLSAAFNLAGLELPVLVECDTGGARCGAPTPDAAADLAQTIARLPGLRFAGLMTYPSSPAFDPFMAAARQRLAAVGLGPERVSGGGTPTLYSAHTYREVTEYRAGEYLYGDRSHLVSGNMPLERIAARVITTVVSRPTPARAILDAGSKALSGTLRRGLQGHGYVVEYPDASLYDLTEEHGHADVSACPRPPEVGERVSVLPNHVCLVSNLFTHLHGVRNGVVEVVWPIAARGLLQ